MPIYPIIFHCSTACRDELSTWVSVVTVNRKGTREVLEVSEHGLGRVFWSTALFYILNFSIWLGFDGMRGVHSCGRRSKSSTVSTYEKIGRLLMVLYVTITSLTHLFINPSIQHPAYEHQSRLFNPATPTSWRTTFSVS